MAKEIFSQIAAVFTGPKTIERSTQLRLLKRSCFLVGITLIIMGGLILPAWQATLASSWPIACAAPVLFTLLLYPKFFTSGLKQPLSLASIALAAFSISILSLVYFLVIVPLSLFGQLFKSRNSRTQLDPSVSSYLENSSKISPRSMEKK